MAEAPRELFADPELSWQAKAAAAVMWSVVRHDAVRPTYWETFAQLSRRLGCTQRQAKRCVEMLSAAGWVARHVDEDGRWATRLQAQATERDPGARLAGWGRPYDRLPDGGGPTGDEGAGSPAGEGEGGRHEGSSSLDQDSISSDPRARETADAGPPPITDALLRDPSVLAQLATYGGQAIARPDLPGPWPTPSPPGGKPLPRMTRPAKQVAERIDAGWTVLELHDLVHGVAELVEAGKLPADKWRGSYVFSGFADTLRHDVDQHRERSDALAVEPEPAPPEAPKNPLSPETLAALRDEARPFLRRVFA